jgi:DNA polymerase I-like protein with 3'-5' exonuclease and polymerase domains
MQALAIRGKPFSAQEGRDLLHYCERDVLTTAELLRRMAPYLTLPALQRGRFTRTAARMLHAGIPLDVDTFHQLRQRREEFVQALVEEVNPSFGVFQGTTFKQDRMEALVQRHNLPWPRLDSGCLSMDKRTWERMTERHPFLQPLHEARRMKSLLRDNSLAVGRDGRNRYGFFPFAAGTGRNAWRAAEFVFAQPSYLRGLIQPAPAKGLAYLDYGQQEFAVAAVLSGDEHMLEAYRADDPYLTFGKQAGLIPPDASKETHAAERKKLKACVLGLQFLITEWGLADQLNIQTDYAKAYISAHRRVYRRFWQWNDVMVDRAMLDGYQQTLLGWRIAIRDGEVMHQGKRARRFNPRAVVNFPVQGGAADVTRLACNRAAERGLAVLANVHDAVLVEGDADAIDDVADEVEALMVQAGRDLLRGVTLKVDRKVIRHPERLLSEETERKRWDWLMGCLGRSGRKRCCIPATADVARQQQG